MTSRGLSFVVGAVLASGCHQAPVAPTAPSVSSNPVLLGTMSCTPPADATVHYVALPGSSTPLAVWIAELSPARGATLRLGDVAAWRLQQDGPTGYTARITAGLTTGPGTPYLGFLAGSAGGTHPCVPTGFSSSAAQLTSRPPGTLHLRLSVWLTAGNTSEPFPVTRPPDYEADESLGWVVPQ